MQRFFNPTVAGPSESFSFFRVFSLWQMLSSCHPGLNIVMMYLGIPWATDGPAQSLTNITACLRYWTLKISAGWKASSEGWGRRLGPGTCAQHPRSLRPQDSSTCLKFKGRWVEGCRKCLVRCASGKLAWMSITLLPRRSHCLRLPGGVEAESLQSCLSADGILTVETPLPSIPLPADVNIPIQVLISPDSCLICNHTVWTLPPIEAQN